jgi:hypothetical protein
MRPPAALLTRSGHHAAVHPLYNGDRVYWILRVTEPGSDVVRYHGPFADLPAARRWADRTFGLPDMERTLMD